MFTETTQELRGNLGVPMDISSPITSDEEYLSPLEESMDFSGPEPKRSIDSRFRKPPAFLVRPYRARPNCLPLLECGISIFSIDTHPTAFLTGWLQNIA